MTSLQDMFHGQTVVPGASLRGYRSWGIDIVDGSFVLASTAVQYVWRPGELLAECAQSNSQTFQRTDVGVRGCDCSMCTQLRSAGGWPARAEYLRDVHPAPVADCKCGFYGWYRPDDTRIIPSTIRGSVRASGRIIMGSHGFRAERVKLEALVLPRVLATDHRTRRLLAELRAGDVHFTFSDDTSMVDLVRRYPPDDVSALVNHECDASCRPTTGTVVASSAAVMTPAASSSLITPQELARLMGVPPTVLGLAPTPRPSQTPRWKRWPALALCAFGAVFCGAGAAAAFARDRWFIAAVDVVGTFFWGRNTRSAWRWR